MTAIIYSLFLIGIGIISLFFSIKSLIDPAFAKKYVDTNPKAWLWRKLFGEPSAITKKFFLILAIIIGFGFIFVGILSFIL